MGIDTVGTPRKLMLEGVSYRIAADANFAENFAKYENTMLPSSGDGMLQKVKRTPGIDSVVLLVNPVELQQILVLNDGIDDFTINYTDAAGSTWRTTGQIGAEPRETDTGRLTLRLDSRNEWTLFAAA